MLYICATPIGNLLDITERVIETLNEVDLIAAEDTSNSIKLLNHFNIKTPMTSYHEFNKYDKADELIIKLREGKDIALISDAGTPAISDPGEVLVKKCHEEGIPVTSLPGACACITALTLSGISTRRFAFEAFLPSDKKERRTILNELVNETRTIIIYEAPHHLLDTLKQLLDVLGDRNITLCKELTKRFESINRTTLASSVEFYSENIPKGEFVLVIEGKSREDIMKEKQTSFENMTIEEHLKSYIDKGIDKKEAMKLVAKDRGVSKRDIYNSLI